jgi:hypothetical protein
MAERNRAGQFIKGVRSHPSTEFKPGQHWRKEKPYWNYDWMYNEYVLKGRSAMNIASEFGVTERAILFWMEKHSIPRRDMKTIRKNKRWGSSGDQNGMFGKRGNLSPQWKGGCTPERQAVYSSLEWASVVQVVYKRDDYKCVRCGAVHKGHIVLHVHHIVSFSVKHLRCEPSNLVLLCKKCHVYVHSRKNKEGEYIGSV